MDNAFGFIPIKPYQGETARQFNRLLPKLKQPFILILTTQLLNGYRMC